MRNPHHSRTKAPTRGRRRAGASRQPPTPVIGTFRPHPRGAGVVEFADTGARGYVLPGAPNLLDGDTVLAEISPDRGDRIPGGRITLVRRSTRMLAGQAEEQDGRLVLRVDPHLGHGVWPLLGPASPGDSVIAELTEDDAAARVLRAWPDPAEPEALRARVLVRNRIPASPPRLPPEPARPPYGGAAPASGPPQGRRDLRHLTVFTIDADHSRDLDDALSVAPAAEDGAIRVLVHIADVTAHVPAGSVLDEQARDVATSVYLPGWTRPMLPAELSEDRLSLLPGQDRDVLTVEMRVDQTGDITATDIYPAVIRSRRRLNYGVAARILTEADPEAADPEIVEALRWLRTAGARLGLRRSRRGGLEAWRIDHDADGGRSRHEASHLLIERLMVATNEAVAAWLIARGMPGVFRTHPAPGPEATAELEAFCRAAGYLPAFGGQITPLGLAGLAAQLDASPGDKAAAGIWDVLLSRLGRARYRPAPEPHFGLASQAYLHFTSPLRRYADMAVHRIVHAFLAGERDPARFPSGTELEALCHHLTGASARAAAAEAQMRRALKLVELGAAGDGTFSGRVSKVSGNGLLVRLDGHGLTGLISSRDAARHGVRHSLGQRIWVRVKNADPMAGELDLLPAPDPGGVRPPGTGDTGPRHSGS
ncbi:RNB domain-containing ribonuclease [Bailinhaonella thermotolerans]|nr:ribonuclease R family protein [Bailinhaonella thermotolerans]